MDHQLSNDFLHSACRLTATFDDGSGKTKTGSGTCFFIRDFEKNDIFLFTNRHVIDIDYKQTTPKYKNYKLTELKVHHKTKDKETSKPIVTNETFILNFSEFIFSHKYENDVACLGNIEIKFRPGNSTELNYLIDFRLIANSRRLLDKLTVCDFVAFPGFPPWYDKFNDLAILRTGTIASDPRFDYSATKEYNGETIAYEAFSFGGSSGSPVFATAKGIQVNEPLIGGSYREPMLIGINAGHLKVKDTEGSHSGISYFYKSSIFLELINEFYKKRVV